VAEDSKIRNMKDFIKNCSYLLFRSVSLSDDGLVFTNIHIFHDESMFELFLKEIMSDPARSDYVNEARAYEKENDIIHICDINTS